MAAYRIKHDGTRRHDFGGTDVQRDALGCGNGGAHSLTNAARLSAGGRAPWSDASAGSGHDVGRVEGSGLVDPPATWEGEGS